MFYVYIIQSEVDDSFYKGFSSDYLKRLIYHNSGESKYTSRKTPWKLVHVEEYESKSEALKREKNLKKAARERKGYLINSSKNILKNV